MFNVLPLNHHMVVNNGDDVHPMGSKSVKSHELKKHKMENQDFFGREKNVRKRS